MRNFKDLLEVKDKEWYPTAAPNVMDLSPLQQKKLIKLLEKTYQGNKFMINENGEIFINLKGFGKTRDAAAFFNSYCKGLIFAVENL